MNYSRETSLRDKLLETFKRFGLFDTQTLQIEATFYGDFHHLPIGMPFIGEIDGMITIVQHQTHLPLGVHTISRYT